VKQLVPQNESQQDWVSILASGEQGDKSKKLCVSAVPYSRQRAGSGLERKGLICVKDP
jgi:hypothetical protein